MDTTGSGLITSTRLDLAARDSPPTETKAAEQRKWDAYYAGMELVEEDEDTRLFNAELVGRISDLLPEGGRTLEAGSGGGWQSLALARTGLFSTSILDFSEEALRYAKRVFDRAGVAAQFILSDIEAPCQAEFDIVFNAGVLEHYTVAQQAQLLRGMARRSRRYVLVLLPNRDCYWYWIWRLKRAASAEWPWGKEVPASGLRKVFEAAGVKYLGLGYLGLNWTESFIKEVTGDSPSLRDFLLTIHKAPVVDLRQKAYMVAALGSVRSEDASPGWMFESEDRVESDIITAALADALAAVIQKNVEIKSLRDRVRQSEVSENSIVQKFLEERSAATQERRSLISVLNSISLQASELQVERQRLGARLELTGDVADRLSDQRERYEAQVRELCDDKLRLENAPSSTASGLAALQSANESPSLSLAESKKDLTTARTAISGNAQELQAFGVSLTIASNENRRLLERIQSIEAQLEEIRTAHAASLRQVENLQRELTVGNERIADLTDEAAKLERNATLAEKALIERDRHIESTKAQVRELSQRYAALKEGLLKAGVAFERDLESALASLRGQRAWQVMLAIRKAYTLWTRQGLRGKLASLLVPSELLFRRDNLSKFDVRLPSIWDHWSGPSDKPSEHVPCGVPNHTTAKTDIVVLPVFDFEFRFQRPQQLASGFANAGHRVFWVSPSRFVGPSSEREFETVPLRENLYELRLSGPQLRIYSDPLDAERAHDLANSIVSLYRAAGLGETIVLVQFPFWRKVALELREQLGARIVYDCMDDWRSWTAEPRISDFSLQQEQLLAEESDVLIATSSELERRLHEESGRPVLRVRNGADFEFFQNAPASLLLQDLVKPVIGYYGAIADWVDVKLMTELAESRPNYTFVIIGEVHGCDVSRLRSLANVQMLGEKHYRLIPSYLRGFDACLFPFVQNRLTKSVDPVKVYEYLSQGKPIIATPLPEVLDHGDLLYFGETAAEFSSQLDRALAESSPQIRAKRIAYAEVNCWRRRVDAIEESLTSAYPLVSILAVSFNSVEFLGPFLDSVRRNTAYPNYELVLVDNCSTDGSQRVLDEYRNTFPQLRITLLKENRGFAAANNIAAGQARGEFFVFLNVDTVVTWGWLGRLLFPLAQNDKVGITAPVTNFSGNETRIQTGYRTLAEMDRFALERVSTDFHRTQELDVVPFLCAAVPRRVWSQVGDLDESFGVGMFEDDDYCIRVRMAGFRILVVEDCFIHHFGNGSFRKIDSAQVLALFEKNRKYFESKWKKTWINHKIRAGVPPLREGDRIPLSEFFGSPELVSQRTPRLILKHLFPSRTSIGQPINLQPNGCSALVAECENASPGTVIRFDGQLLQTACGNSFLLSAELPDHFNRIPRRIPVSLVNDQGESDTLLFQVED